LSRGQMFHGVTNIHECGPNLGRRHGGNTCDDMAKHEKPRKCSATPISPCLARGWDGNWRRFQSPNSSPAPQGCGLMIRSARSPLLSMPSLTDVEAAVRSRLPFQLLEWSCKLGRVPVSPDRILNVPVLALRNPTRSAIRSSLRSIKRIGEARLARTSSFAKGIGFKHLEPAIALLGHGR
jgi:hypothetical protein